MKRKQAALSQCLAEQRSDPDPFAILSAIAGEIVAVDRRGMIVYANRAWRDLVLKYGSSDPTGGLGRPYRGCGAAADEAQDVAESLRALKDVLEGRISHFSGIFPRPVCDESGWFKVDISPLDGGGAVILHVDVTALRRAEERALYLASQDPLTGLANRATFRGHVEVALGRARRNKSYFGLLLLDLDNFKVVNDTYGHLAGDRLLVTVATRLRQRMRRSDVVGRLGGDEFGLLISDLVREKDLCRVGSEIVELIRRPVTVAADKIKVSVSVGLSAYPADGESVDALLIAADAALYAAKRHGRDEWHWARERYAAT